MNTRLVRVAGLCAVLGLALACGSEREERAEEAAPRAAPKLQEAPRVAPGDVQARLSAAAGRERPRIALDSLAAPAPTLAPGLPVSAREAKDAALSPDASAVVTLRAPEDDGPWQVVTWDLETGEETSAVALAEDEEPSEVAFRHDGARLAVTLSYQGVALIDPQVGSILGRVGSDEDVLERAVFTPDGGRLVGGTQRAVEAWDATSLERLARTPSASPFEPIGFPACGPGAPSECTTVENREGFLSPTGRFYVQASEGVVAQGHFRLVARQAHLYEPDGLTVRCAVRLDEDAELSPDAFAAGDGLFAFVTNEFDGPEFSVWVIDTSTCAPPEGAGAGDVPEMLSARFVVVHAATLTALIVGDSHSAELWKPTSVAPPRVGLSVALDAQRSLLLGAAFSAGGERVALFSFDGRLRTFETAGGTRLSEIQVGADRERLVRVAFLPDGRRALVTIQTRGSAAVLVDTDTGQVLRRFQ